MLGNDRNYVMTFSWSLSRLSTSQAYSVVSLVYKNKRSAKTRKIRSQNKQLVLSSLDRHLNIMINWQ